MFEIPLHLIRTILLVGVQNKESKLNVDPVLCTIRHGEDLIGGASSTARRRNTTLGVQTIDFLHTAGGAGSLGLEPQPLDVRRWLRGICVLNLLGLCVTEAKNVKVGRGVIHEEMGANGGRLSDGAQCCRTGGRVGSQFAGGIEEFCHGPNSSGRCGG